MKVIAIVGFPRAGKSTICNILGKRPGWLVIRGCPDGEGHWTFETPNGKSLRKKGQFNEAFLSFVERSVIGARRYLNVILDLGGVQSPENERLLRLVDEVIIVGQTPQDIESWERFCGKPVAAKYLSKWTGEKMEFKELHSAELK